MENPVKVSVIMPSLNSEAYLRECLDSVISQTLKDIEILFIDAGSTDNTLNILSEYLSKDSRIKLVNSERKSYGYQVNLGLKLARGTYWGILETDDFIKPNMYELLYNLAEKNKVDIVKADFCTFEYKDGKYEYDYRPIIRLKDLYNTVINPLKDLRAFRGYGINPPGLYRLDLIRKNNIQLNETPGASYQDNGLWFQMFATAQRVYFYNKAFYMVRRDNPNSSIKSKNKVYCLCDEYDFIRTFLSKNPILEKKLAPICAYFRYGNYCFTLNRIADEYKRDFIKKFSQDFNNIKAAGELNESLYSSMQLAQLGAIMQDPEKYYFTQIHINAFPNDFSPDQSILEIERLKKELMFARQENTNLVNSYSYRIGKTLTFIPRKVRGGINCIADHGIIYTFFWFLKKHRR